MEGCFTRNYYKTNGFVLCIVELAYQNLVLNQKKDEEELDRKYQKLKKERAEALIKQLEPEGGTPSLAQAYDEDANSSSNDSSCEAVTNNSIVFVSIEY